MYFITAVLTNDDYLYKYKTSSLHTYNLKVENSISRIHEIKLNRFRMYKLELCCLETGDYILEGLDNLINRTDILGLYEYRDCFLILLLNFYEASIFKSLRFLDSHTVSIDELTSFDVYKNIVYNNSRYKFISFVKYTKDVLTVEDKEHKVPYIAIIDIILENVNCKYDGNILYFNMGESKLSGKRLFSYEIDDMMSFKANIAKLQLLEG